MEHFQFDTIRTKLTERSRVLICEDKVVNPDSEHKS